VTTLAWALLAEWGLTAVGALVFLVLYGRPGKYEDRTMAWHVASVTAVALLEAAGLLLVAAGVRIPLWVFVAVYGVATGVVYWRLALLLTTRRASAGPGNGRTPAA
jgi:hypothetical protein